MSERDDSRPALSSALEVWLEAARADADRRNLPELKPLLDSLARSTAALRAADERYRSRADPDAPREIGLP